MRAALSTNAFIVLRLNKNDHIDPFFLLCLVGKQSIELNILLYKDTAVTENAYGKEIQRFTWEENLTLWIAFLQSRSKSVNYNKKHRNFRMLFFFSETIMFCFAAAVLLSKVSLIKI